MRGPFGDARLHDLEDEEVAAVHQSVAIQLALEARVAFLDPYRCYVGAYRLR